MALCSLSPKYFKVIHVLKLSVHQCLEPKVCNGRYQEEETKSWKKLINVAVSGAAGMISNHLLFKVGILSYHPTKITINGLFKLI